MATTVKQAAVLLLVLGLMIGTSSCVMEDRTVEFVVTDNTCAEFSVDHSSMVIIKSAPVFLGNEIDRILNENDVSRDDIVSVNIVSATYGVTSFSGSHNWTISGAVTVERGDITAGPDTLLSYTSQSVSAALGKKIPVPLDSAGVGLVTQALKDVVSGTSNVILVFNFVNSGVTPPPSVSDRIQFDWEVCVALDIVTKKDTEVPDPF